MQLPHRSFLYCNTASPRNQPKLPKIAFLERASSSSWWQRGICGSMYHSKPCLLLHLFSISQVGHHFAWPPQPLGLRRKPNRRRNLQKGRNKRSLRWCYSSFSVRGTVQLLPSAPLPWPPISPTPPLYAF